MMLEHHFSREGLSIYFAEVDNLDVSPLMH